MFCKKCGKEINDDAVVCVHCGCAVTERKTGVFDTDEINVGLCLLAVLVPLFGLIYWLVKKDECPYTAKVYGSTSLVMAILSVMFYYALMSGEI